MQFQLFNFRPQNQLKDNFVSISGDIPSFDEAFDTDSLKKFYRQQSQPLLTVCTNFTPFFAKAKAHDFEFDEASSPSIDERETQASPLTRYISKYSQETSPVEANLDYQFYGEHDPIYESNPVTEVPRQPIENYYAKTAAAQQAAIRLQDCRPNVYPQLNMNTPNNMFPLAKCAQSLTVYRKDTQSTDCSDTDRSPTGFEKLILTKRIFKIVRDTKPRVPPKQKASSPKMKPVKIPGPKVAPLAKVELSIQAMPSMPSSQERSPVQAGPAPVMSFLNIMQEKGFTPEQVMSEIQKFVHHPKGENFSAKKN